MLGDIFKVLIYIKKLVKVQIRDIYFGMARLMRHDNRGRVSGETLLATYDLKTTG